MRPARITSPTKALTRDLATRSRAMRKERKDLVGLEAVASAPTRNDLLPQIKLEQRAVDDLKAPARLLRKVTPEHVTEISQSIQNFGIVKPLLITADGTIVDGVSTREAAIVLGITTVPCIVIDHLNKNEVRLLRMALNRLGEKGRWDEKELAVEFKDLASLGAPVGLSGFTLPEIDILATLDEPVVDKKANDVPEKPSEAETVSRLGDCWLLGRHRVLCADATKFESYAALFGDIGPARAVISDPPYNIKIDGFAVGAGALKHREFVAASGEMSEEEFETFLAQFLAAASEYVVEGGILFTCMDWRHASNVEHAAKRVGLTHINTVVWSKGNAGLGGLYRSAHEFVLVFRKGDAPSVNNVKLGKHGRDRTNVWVYPGANQRGSSANAMLANHPTPKPVELLADAMFDVTNRDDVVLDPFAGSGTSVIAAQKSGRTAFVLELDPAYVDLIVKRFEAFTKIAAVHEASGMTFADVAKARVAEAHSARAEETAEGQMRTDVAGASANRPRAENFGSEVEGEVLVENADVRPEVIEVQADAGVPAINTPATVMLNKE